MKFILFILLSSIIGKGQTDRTQIITIEPYMAVTNAAFFKTMVVKSNDCAADFIQGFNFQWGYSYKLKIKIHKLKNPPEDGSDTDYILLKTISKTKVPDTYQFKMLLDRDLYLGEGEQTNNFKSINDSTYSYFDKIEIEVTSSLKNEFNKIVNEGQVRHGNFVFIRPTKIKLIEFI